MVDIVFLTPGPNVEMLYLKSMLKTIQVLESKGITWAFYGEFSSHVAVAREITFDIAKDEECKVYFWIDSDIVWKPEDVVKLYESDKDAVSGCYFMREGQIAAATYEGFVEGYTVCVTKDLFKIKYAGMGFFAVKAHVMKNMTELKFTPTVLDDIEGEDAAFCKKIVDQGFDIWLDPTVHLGHMKKVQKVI